METPNDFSGQLTELIMTAFSKLNQNAVVKLETPEYNKVYGHIYRTLSSTGINERMESHYNAENSYKSRMYEKYKKQAEMLEDAFPRGMFTKTKDGDLVGINVIIKKFLVEMLELKNETKS